MDNLLILQEQNNLRWGKTRKKGRNARIIAIRLYKEIL